jgi:hypothetical protein
MALGTGVRLDFAPVMCDIASCTAFSSTRGATVELYNNLVRCDDASGACIQVQGLLISNNNDLFGPVIGIRSGTSYTSLASWRSAIFADKDSISVDPGFADAEYRLQEHSPCVNRGRSGDLLTQALYPRDYFAGVNPERVRAGQIDIGADEVDAPDLGAKFIRGDANGDGVVNPSDINFIGNYLFSGGPAPACLDSADANDDELVNISDMSWLSTWLFLESGGTLQWIQPPYPECGVDPFGFELFCSTPSPPCAP